MMCGTIPLDKISSRMLRVDNINKRLRGHHLRWWRHPEQMKSARKDICGNCEKIKTKEN